MLEVIWYVIGETKIFTEFGYFEHEGFLIYYVIPLRVTYWNKGFMMCNYHLPISWLI